MSVRGRLAFLCAFALFLVGESSSSSDHDDSYYAYRHPNRDTRPTAVKLLDLDEGDVCRKSRGSEPDYVCLSENICGPLADGAVSGNRLDLCSFNGTRPIVCCPSSAIGKRSKRQNSGLAARKCEEYSRYAPDNRNVDDADSGELTAGEKYLETILKMLGGPRIAKHQEFPHMAMLGYGKTAEEMDWRCAGSLISERWILTAAHCHKMGAL